MEETKKKTMGRRKIEIKKIEKKSNLQVTFTKRRMGLFRKASELSVLCGSEIAILVQSPAQKIFAFGHPSVDAVANRLHAAVGSAAPASYIDDGGRSRYEEAVRRLAAEKRSAVEDTVAEKRDRFWWNEPIEGMELHELEGYVEGMEGLLGKLLELEKRKLGEEGDLLDVVSVDGDRVNGFGGLGATTTSFGQFDEELDLDVGKWLGWS